MHARVLSGVFDLALHVSGTTVGMRSGADETTDFGSNDHSFPGMIFESDTSVTSVTQSEKSAAQCGKRKLVIRVVNSV